MSFSNEELYSMYGQYNQFVRVDFTFGSQAYEQFGPSIMGEIVYTLQERNRLEEVLKQSDVPRTEAKIKFKLYDADAKFSAEQKTALDREGFLCSDILQVWSSTYRQVNRFNLSDRKDLPNVIEIPFDPRGFNYNGSVVNHGDSIIDQGGILSPEELDEYHGTKLYYIEKEGGEIPFDYFNTTGKIKDSIQYYKYKAQQMDGQYSDNDDKEFIRIGFDRISARLEYVRQELKQAGLDEKAILQFLSRHLKVLINTCLYFKGETLLMGRIPIWWDFERYIHIFFRHVPAYKFDGIFSEKTNFTYELKAIDRVIHGVLESIRSEIENHFTNNPNKSFRRNGARSVFYDGVYYQVEIEPSGRLLWFHPRN